MIHHHSEGGMGSPPRNALGGLAGGVGSRNHSRRHRYLFRLAAFHFAHVRAEPPQFVSEPQLTWFSVFRPTFERAQPSRWIRPDPLARSEPSPIVPIFCELAPLDRK